MSNLRRCAAAASLASLALAAILLARAARAETKSPDAKPADAQAPDSKAAHPPPANAASAPIAAPPASTAPRYAADGQLLAPGNYRDWIFVGASLGLSYTEPAKDADAGREREVFHQTYLQPEAYARYRATGEFPEGTTLILELYRAETKAEPAKGGRFEGDRVALEVAVKDHTRFPEGWAYFNFALKEGRPVASARAFPAASCHACHAAHAAEDNVFTQFYPVLREARRDREGAPPKDGKTSEAGKVYP